MFPCRSWTRWMPFATDLVATRSVWAISSLPIPLTRPCLLKDPMSKSFCPSDSISTNLKISSKRTLIITIWVSQNEKGRVVIIAKKITIFCLCFTVAPGGDHVLSLVDEISYRAPPAPPLSQMHELNPELFCNGDNRSPDCSVDCRCTHMIDVPLNSVVEIVLVDEGKFMSLVDQTPLNII